MSRKVFCRPRPYKAYKIVVRSAYLNECNLHSKVATVNKLMKILGMNIVWKKNK